jgi:hypothetical protein
MFKNIVTSSLALGIVGLFTLSCYGTKTSEIPKQDKVVQTLENNPHETLDDYLNYLRLKEQGLLGNTSSYDEPQKPEILEQRIFKAVFFTNIVVDDLDAQVVWLQRHLELVLSTLEVEHQLEPILTDASVDIPSGSLLYFIEPQIPLSLLNDPNCFVKPYQKPVMRLYEDGAFEEKMPETLKQTYNKSTEIKRKANEMESRIDNFHKRLQRLEPLIKKP